jgi:hypothetical protein
MPASVTCEGEKGVNFLRCKQQLLALSVGACMSALPPLSREVRTCYPILEGGENGANDPKADINCATPA